MSNFKNLALVSAFLLLFAGAAVSSDQNIQSSVSVSGYEALEEAGLEPDNAPSPMGTGSAPGGTIPTLDSIPPDGVLLIPESTNDVVGMYDPMDGTFLGNLISGGGMFSTPINAIRGPDGNIYVSDQMADAIFVFDTTGTYLLTYADGSDGLDNIRGIDFRNDTLFVTTIHSYVARFAGPHNRITDFFSGAGAFDIHFLDNGQSLLASHASPNGVWLYDVDGTYISQLLDASFPEQVNSDDLLPGGFLNGTFTGDVIIDFDLDGTIHQTTPLDLCRGAYRLGNGNILATNGSGVFELDPGSGNVIQQHNTGSARFIELYKPEATGIDDNASGLPRVYTLAQNFPNPFNAQTQINFALSNQSDVTIEIYNLLGQKIATLTEGLLPAGTHTVNWDASDVASGIYYYKLTAGDYTAVKKMTLLK